VESQAHGGMIIFEGNLVSEFGSINEISSLTRFFSGFRLRPVQKATFFEIRESCEVEFCGRFRISLG
jgi:hypothetical protein